MRQMQVLGAVGDARRFSDSVIAAVLAANVSETFTVPTDAEHVRICATAATYVQPIEDGEDTDLVTNGTFASDTGWTKGTGWTIAGGVAASDGSQAGNSDLSQTPTGANAVIEGKAYAVTFTVSNYSAGNVRAVLGAGTAGTNRAANGTFVENLVAGADGTLLLRADLDFVGSIDNLSVAPIAHVPAADQITGEASELLAPGIPETYDVSTVSKISLVSAATSIVTMSFYGPRRP